MLSFTMAPVKDSIPVPRDYDFQYNFEFLRRSPKELLHIIEGASVLKALSFGGRKILVSLTPSTSSYELQYLNVVPSDTERHLVIQFVKEWLDLETNLNPFYKLASTDGLLKNAVAKYKGYRIVGQPDLFESLVWAITGQQINLSFAYTLKQRLIEKYGGQVIWNGKSYYTFPSPQDLSNAAVDELLILKFSTQKAKYIKFVAEAFLSGAVSKDLIGNMSFLEARQHLMAIKGVGNWTANYALMKTFRSPQAFPLEDAGLHNAIKRIKQLKAKPTVDQVKRLFKKYKGWEAYATLYLWKTLEE
jgi:DNA-3-methyladenine glycosylase II